jgi:hypothetical protein
VYGFRKHFRNQHGFEPKSEHCLVQTISQAHIERQNNPGRPGYDDRYLDGETRGGNNNGGGRIPSPRSEMGRPIPSPRSDMGGRPIPSPRSEMGRPIPSPRSDMGGWPIPSPRSDLVRPIIESPRSRSSESPGEGGELRRRRSFQDKGRPLSRSSAPGGGGGEEREDTKFLECQECGQTFQLNDFGSYKRHCRQHGQMRSGVSQS